MAVDAHANFAYSTVATAPSPATSGTSLVVAAGDGAKMPSVPFNATVWATGANAISTNAEIVRVTAISTDTLTITRAQESSTARTVVVGDQIAATITKKTFTDIEGSLAPLTTRGDFLTRDASNNIRIGPTLLGHTLMFDGTDSTAKVVRAQRDAGALVSNTATLTSILTTPFTLQSPFVAGDVWRLVIAGRYLNSSGVAISPTMDIQIAGVSLAAAPLTISTNVASTGSAHNHHIDLTFTVSLVAASGTVQLAGLSMLASSSAPGWTNPAALTDIKFVGNSVTAATNADMTLDVKVAPGVNGSGAANYSMSNITLFRLPKV
jgi:hypothetical protein